jgi:molybdopterin/thiamine biosynthesis adenylyltransferase
MITDEERKRYARQILMIGEEGQERLKAASILVAGAGGLGTVISLYLAAAGIGRLRIIDCDVVDTSNLNRQILHWSKDVGRPKTASVKEKLAALNPLIRIETDPGRITEESVGDLVWGHDAASCPRCNLIVDAMDNFPTRYLLNRTAVDRNVPFIHGAVRFRR